MFFVLNKLIYITYLTKIFLRKLLKFAFKYLELALIETRVNHLKVGENINRQLHCFVYCT